MSSIRVQPAELRSAVSHLKRPLQDLFWQLLADGWAPAGAAVPGINGEVLVALDHGTARVLLLHDRGVPGVEAQATSWSGSYPPTVWREFLNSASTPAPQNLEREIAVLQEDLPSIVAAIADGRATQAALRAASWGHADATKAPTTTT